MLGFGSKTCCKKEESEPGVSLFKWFSEEGIDEAISKGSIYDIVMLLAIHRRTKHFKNLIGSIKILSK
tara:strand:- start:471 stop:674 length:204 start_codon:yes stop_codon:yes gene_type:complete